MAYISQSQEVSSVWRHESEKELSPVVTVSVLRTQLGQVVQVPS